MLIIPEIKFMDTALNVFKLKMISMGIDISIVHSNHVFHIYFKSNDFLGSHRATANILAIFLSYCFKKKISFDHNGKLNIKDDYIQPDLDSHDAILIMFRKWKSEVDQQNSI